MNRYMLKAIMLSLLIIILSGCSFSPDEGLFALPKLPTEYVALQEKLDEIVSEGAQYAVAETGANRQAVQLMDIDADGENEAIACFMSGGTIRAYIFKYLEDEYEEIGFIETYGRRLCSVDYPLISEKGERAVAVSGSFDDTVTFGMCICRIDSQELVKMLDTQYTSVLFEDYDGDGADEIFFAVCNGASNAYSAQMYKLSESEYKLLKSAPMCIETKSVAHMQTGLCANERRALFIDSAATGGGYVTDVLALDGNGASNLTIDSAGGSGMTTWRQSAVYCADINGDGVTDVPVFEGSEPKNKIYWKDFSEDSEETVSVTYHNVQDRWYMKWPSQWEDSVYAERNAGQDITTTTFYVPQTQVSGVSGEIRNAILTLYIFSGDNSTENLKSYPGMKVLATSGATVYGYLLIENDYAQYAVSDEEVKEAFCVIEQTWNTEE